MYLLSRRTKVSMAPVQGNITVSYIGNIFNPTMLFMHIFSIVGKQVWDMLSALVLTYY